MIDLSPRRAEHIALTFAGMPLKPTLSRRGRDGLLTPGGSDLMAVVNRNADKLRVLQNMPDTGSTEALDQFLATFVAQSNQVMHHLSCRLMPSQSGCYL